MRLILLVISAAVLSACSVLNNSHKSSQPLPAETVYSPNGEIQSTQYSEMSTPEAARVDAGIVVSPDTLIDAAMQIITPPANVDPGMIIPGAADTLHLTQNDD